ncbi:hypothetical protein AWB68_06351 [Caballeronia choica]|uniref:Uncharacterized protein n=1 Tax=Caballeronia choica TaxID=326476 RepID=A0A158KLR0_9BURK|nr:hypothetical protein AWB68_06351 [Caballeronia choica]
MMSALLQTIGALAILASVAVHVSSCWKAQKKGAARLALPFTKHHRHR